ncbi:glycosyltransferase family 2 protein [Bacillus salipaludis]|uniref:Glycosyltransferase family 2 protein n=1 Tax=Bacillus salipaludis TaxID=2547811 RepID=A0ABW8RBU3_9BACI
MNPKISIIVPVYNVEPYIHKCIDSILKQTFEDFELILVDDGSPDNCGKICDEYSKLDNRIKVLHKENGGVSSARNAGIRTAKGEYIGFVDSDDFIHQRMYELLYSYGIKHTADVVLCDYLVVNDEEMHNTNYDIPEFNEEQYSNIESLYQLYTNLDIQFVIPCNKLFRRSLFNNLKFIEGKRHEDEIIAHRILFKSSKVTYLPIKLYYYFQRKDSFMKSFNIERLDVFYAFKDRIEFFKEIKQPELEKKAEFSYIGTLFLYYFKAKREVPHSGQVLKALKKDFCMNLGTFVKNPYFIRKEKICWFLFVVHPSLYQLYINYKSRNWLGDTN